MNNKNINLYKEIYSKKNNYLRNLKPMYRIINSYINFDCKSFLDFGCGEGNLGNLFEKYNNYIIYKYDPAIEKYSYLKENLKVDLVANCDVMEHIPEDEIDNIFLKISKISKNVFFNIHLDKAEKILSNGENAHCTIKPKNWWQKKIKKYFGISNIVWSSYNKSVSIITWKITLRQKIKVSGYIFLNYLERCIYHIRFDTNNNSRYQKIIKLIKG